MVNPKLVADPGHPLAGLAGVGVAYKLAQALTARARVGNFEAESLLDLVALGLVADLAILRGGEVGFAGETSTGLMKRTWEDLSAYLFRELDFPQGALLMTGTGIVPPETFSLQPDDTVQITVGELPDDGA